MALEEKEKTTIVGACFEAKEEVKVTPPARPKKAERMKNIKLNGNLPQQPACECKISNTSLKEQSSNGGVSASDQVDKKDEPDPFAAELDLKSQVGAMYCGESRETENGMPEMSISAEVNGDERPFGITVGNSVAETKQFVVLVSEKEFEVCSKESEEVAATINLFRDIKEEQRVGFESCISPDTTSGSHDEESFFSAEEAESSVCISSSLRDHTETVNEANNKKSEHSEGLSSIGSEKTNVKEEAVFNLLAESGQNLCGTQVSDTKLNVSANESKSPEDLGNACSDRQILPDNFSKDSQTAETAFPHSSCNNTPITDVVDCSSVDLVADAHAIGAVGGVLETDTESEEEWSSSTNTSTEGEYDVHFFERHCGILEEDFKSDSEDGMNEILSAFPSGTELVSVTTDSEDDSNRGDTPRSFHVNNTGHSNLLLFGDNESDTAINMLACFSPKSECPVVVDDITTDPDLEKMISKSGPETAGDPDFVQNNNTKHLSELGSLSAEIMYKDLSDNDRDYAFSFGSSNAVDRPPVESSLPYRPSADEKNINIKTTGSSQLTQNHGSLKIVDTKEIQESSEDVRKCKILTIKSHKDATIDSEETVDNVGHDCVDAIGMLQNTVSESKTLNEEFKSVCDNIATLERMSMQDTKASDCESETSGGGLVAGTVGPHGVVMNANNGDPEEQKPVFKLPGVTISESATDCEQGNTETNDGTVEDYVDNASSNIRRKQKPRKLTVANRYSFDSEAGLVLSPEDDDNSAELKHFVNTGSFYEDRDKPVATNTQESTGKVTIDAGLEGVTSSLPAPLHRNLSGRQRLGYSESFSPGVSRVVNVRSKEGIRAVSKRARERRSKTLPNNVFDIFKTSSSSLEQVGPITLITDNMPATLPGFPVNRRAQVALELYTTERSYVRRLETVLQLFKKPCEENNLLDKKELHTMFMNIEEIYSVNKDLLFMLLERINHWHDQQCVGDIFLSYNFIERMKIYARYCNNYDAAERLYKEKIRKKEFEAFVNSCYEHQVCQAGLNLPAYLISVVQRIPRYLLLLQDLRKRTPENHLDHGDLTKALNKMEHLAEFINNKLQTAVGMKAMEQLRLRVEGLKALEGRALIKEADVVVNGHKKTRQAWLLNDMLVFAAKGVSRTSEVERTFDLLTLWCMDLQGNNPQTVKEESLEIYTPEHSYIMYAGTKNEKKVWLQKLRTVIAQALHGEEANESYEIESRKATFTYKDGRNYCGNYVSGKRHGQGTLSWPNQAKYQGNWEDDDRCGWGELMYNSGDKYKGEWLDDKQHGVGTMQYTNDDVYRGEWYQGDMHGKGVIDFKNGDRFEGDFYHNEIHGIGELRCVSGLSYQGDWRHSKKHGKGRMHFPNGDVYIGEFANDQFSGQGEMQFADGSVYKGQWIDNRRGGQGEFRSPDGTHYIGGWSKDLINGYGYMKYSIGDCYSGNWFKNTRYGQGVMKYTNGDVYEGQFEYDLCSKNGKMAYKDGSVYEGSWSNNLRHGEGKMVYANKSVYEGHWFYGMRHFEGVLTYANQARYRGQWELDKQQGRGMYTDSSTGYHYEGEWKNGLKHGKGVENTQEGRYEGEWKDNMRHGQGTEILSCETIYEGRWKENKKHGPGIKKLKSGMVEEQNWFEGKQVDITSIDVIELPLIQRR